MELKLSIYTSQTSNDMFIVPRENNKKLHMKYIKNSFYKNDNNESN